MFTFSVPNCPRQDSQTVGAGVGVGVGGVEGGGVQKIGRTAEHDVDTDE